MAEGIRAGSPSSRVSRLAALALIVGSPVLMYAEWGFLTTGAHGSQLTGGKPRVSDHTKEVTKWRESRLKDLTGDDGWLTLVGLLWLKQGPNSLGSGPGSDLLLPEGMAPAHVGTVTLDRDGVKLDAAPGSHVSCEGKPVTHLALKPDTDGLPAVLNLGTLSFYVIKRGDRYGLRVKDKNSPARVNFRGLDYYEIDSKWRIEATFEPHSPVKKIPILNVLGMVNDEPSPGALTFVIDGKKYRLDALAEEGTKQLFIIFRDATSGKETYGAGRFLYADPPDENGKVILDFNEAYNPPCAFTPFATCPLPPKQNRLPIAIAAGEKKYAGSPH
ncbi:MAG TPA: DUF1684 domain-containing protein [Blastocatellia bacterium]|nr:DUF1684 domain-containing protein [Blastocatellia bacterium]